MRAIDRRCFVLTAAGALLAGTARADDAKLGDLGPAPEFTGLGKWLGSEPLTVAGLRGKVVLIDFWTYSCINCLRTLPYVTRWYDTYKDRGFVVVGVHTPEFAFERNAANVQTAMNRFGIHYPVVQDNSFATWKAFDTKYWPTSVLIDRGGRIVLKHEGEGRYDEMENAIRTLVAAGPAVAADNGTDLSKIGSPEMYFGLSRVENLASPETPREGEAAYTAPATLPVNTFALVGHWNLADENATLTRDGGEVRLRFKSGKVFMVASSPEPVPVGVMVDGKQLAPVTVGDSRLYTLFDSADYGEHTLTLAVPKAGLQAFTFTFG